MKNNEIKYALIGALLSGIMIGVEQQFAQVHLFTITGGNSEIIKFLITVIYGVGWVGIFIMGYMAAKNIYKKYKKKR